MRWFNEVALRAGLKSPAKVLAVIASIATVVAAVSFEFLGLWVLSLALGLGIAALCFDAVKKKSQRRSKQILAEWPSILESLESAIRAGLSIQEAIRDLAESHNLESAKDFAEAMASLESGLSLPQVFEALKTRFALPVCDLSFEILRQSVQSGGHGLADVLAEQAEQARESESLLAQIQAKQGWVLGTAKLAVASPWIVLILVASRAENAQAFSSLVGSAITMVGLAASILAFRMVNVIGQVPLSPRVLS